MSLILCRHVSLRWTQPAVALVAAFLLSSCALTQERVPFTGQYVDYQCRPVPHSKLIIVEFDRPRFLSRTKSEYHTVHTDDQGYFHASVVPHRYIQVLDRDLTASNPDGTYPVPLRQLGLTHGGKPNNKELDELARTTQASPLVVYAPNNYGETVSRHHRYESISLKAALEQYGQFRLSSLDQLPQLRWTLDGNLVSFQLISFRGGGVQAYDATALPFPSKLPFYGYGKDVRFSIPLSELDGPTAVKRAFFFRSVGGRRYGTLLFSITGKQKHEQIGGYLEAYAEINLTVVANFLQGAREFRISPSLPPERCGGTLARNDNGFYTRYSAPSAPQGITKIVRPLGPTRLEKIAADPETPDVWYEQAARDPRIALAALNNRGRIESRIAKIFEIVLGKFEFGDEPGFQANNARKAKESWKVLEKIATDSRTSKEILFRLWRDQRFATRLASHLGANPNSPKELLGEIIDMTAQNPALYADEIVRQVGGNPNATREQLARLSDLPVTTSSAWSNLIANRHTAPDVLRKSFRTVIKPSYLNASAFPVRMDLSNPHIPSDVLIELEQILAANSKASSSDRKYHRQVLTHPNFPIHMLDENRLAVVKGMPSDNGRRSGRYVTTEQIASDPNTSKELLLRYASEQESWRIHAAIASNPSAPPELLRMLFEGWHFPVADEFERRREVIEQALLCNPSTPDWVRVRLPFDLAQCR